MFISVEGIDNLGKSTVCKYMKEYLEKRKQIVILVSDPPVEVEPWKSWKDAMTGSHELTDPARATLFLAARLDAVSRIIQPALERKAIVIADRFIDSWFAYQVTKFEKFMPREKSFQLLLELHRLFLSARLMVEPDKTFLVIDDPKVLAHRGKDKASSVYDEIPTQERVQINYVWLAGRLGKNRIKIINASGRNSIEISEEICREIPIDDAEA